MAGIREHGDLENHPADAPLPSGPSSLTEGKQGMLGRFPSRIAFELLILELFLASVFQPGVLLLASRNTKSGFWPVPSK